MAKNVRGTRLPRISLHARPALHGILNKNIPAEFALLPLLQWDQLPASSEKSSASSPGSLCTAKTRYATFFDPRRGEDCCLRTPTEPPTIHSQSSQRRKLRHD